MTDPPVIGNVALFLARRFRVPLVVISQDVFPEIALELGAPEESVPGGHPAAGASASTSSAPTGSWRSVRAMRVRLEEKGAPRERLQVIPNWAEHRRDRPGRTRQRLGA